MLELLTLSGYNIVSAESGSGFTTAVVSTALRECLDGEQVLIVLEDQHRARGLFQQFNEYLSGSLYIDYPNRLIKCSYNSGRIWFLTKERLDYAGGLELGSIYLHGADLSDSQLKLLASRLRKGNKLVIQGPVENSNIILGAVQPLLDNKGFIPEGVVTAVVKNEGFTFKVHKMLREDNPWLVTAEGQNYRNCLNNLPVMNMYKLNAMWRKI